MSDSSLKIAKNRKGLSCKQVRRDRGTVSKLPEHNYSDRNHRRNCDAGDGVPGADDRGRGAALKAYLSEPGANRLRRKAGAKCYCT